MNKMIEEYEDRLNEMQSKLEEKKQLTRSEIMASKPYKDLNRKYEKVSLFSVCYSFSCNFWLKI